MDEDCLYFIAYQNQSVEHFVSAGFVFRNWLNKRCSTWWGNFLSFFFFLFFFLPCCSEFRGKAEEMHASSFVFYLPLVTHTNSLCPQRCFGIYTSHKHTPIWEETRQLSQKYNSIEYRWDTQKQPCCIFQ